MPVVESAERRHEDWIWELKKREDEDEDDDDDDDDGDEDGSSTSSRQTQTSTQPQTSRVATTSMSSSSVLLTTSSVLSATLTAKPVSTTPFSQTTPTTQSTSTTPSSQTISTLKSTSKTLSSQTTRSASSMIIGTMPPTSTQGNRVQSTSTNYLQTTFVASNVAKGSILDTSDPSLSPGAIAGITIGATAGLAVLILVLFFIYRRFLRREVFVVFRQPSQHYEDFSHGPRATWAGVRSSAAALEGNIDIPPAISNPSATTAIGNNNPFRDPNSTPSSSNDAEKQEPPRNNPAYLPGKRESTTGQIESNSQPRNPEEVAIMGHARLVHVKGESPSSEHGVLDEMHIAEAETSGDLETLKSAFMSKRSELRTDSVISEPGRWKTPLSWINDDQRKTMG